jgi:hypothetical protein
VLFILSQLSNNYGTYLVRNLFEIRRTSEKVNTSSMVVRLYNLMNLTVNNEESSGLQMVPVLW